MRACFFFFLLIFFFCYIYLFIVYFFDLLFIHFYPLPLAAFPARANGGFIPGLGNIVGRGGHEGPRAVEEAGTMAMRMGGRGPQRGQPVTSVSGVGI